MVDTKMVEIRVHDWSKEFRNAFWEDDGIGGVRRWIYRSGYGEYFDAADAVATSYRWFEPEPYTSVLRVWIDKRPILDLFEAIKREALIVRDMRSLGEVHYILTVMTCSHTEKMGDGNETLEMLYRRLSDDLSYFVSKNFTLDEQEIYGRCVADGA